MLKQFFKLNAPFEVFKCEDELTRRLNTSRGVQDILYQPDTLGPLETPIKDSPFKDKTFTNVSFAKTTVSGINFNNCEFVDCLFIGTRFVDCEFHDCKFSGCNTHKSIFKNTYINPAVFEGMLDPASHSNIGIHLFQQLFENSTAKRQSAFANNAEFNKHKWARYVLNYKYRGWKKVNLKYVSSWLSNFARYVFAGYGIRAKFLAAWAAVAMIGSFGLNFLLWERLNVVGWNGPVADRNLVEVVYYTTTIPGSLGDLTPASSLGRGLFLVEALIGLIFISVFVGWLVRRAVR